MSKLLRANFARLIKSKPFWICLWLMAFCGAFFPFSQRDNISLDCYFFTYCLCIGVTSAFFASMFIGTNYSCGTLRNKISAGSKRLSVYISDFVTVYAASLIFCGAGALGSICVLLPLRGGFTNFSAAQIISAAVCSAFNALLYSALFSALSELISSKASSAVVCITAAYFMLFAGIYTVSRLEEPMTFGAAYYMNENMELEFVPEQLNPLYLDGAKRRVFEILRMTVPGAQSYSIVVHTGNDDIMKEYIPRASLCALAISAAAVSAGTLGFQRKDLK